MTDAPPLSDAELAKAEAMVREDAAALVAHLRQRAIPLDVAVAILSVALSDLLSIADSHTRQTWTWSDERRH